MNFCFILLNIFHEWYADSIHLRSFKERHFCWILLKKIHFLFITWPSKFMSVHNHNINVKATCIHAVTEPDHWIYFSLQIISPEVFFFGSISLSFQMDKFKGLSSLTAWMRVTLDRRQSKSNLQWPSNKWRIWQPSRSLLPFFQQPKTVHNHSKPIKSCHWVHHYA